MECFIMDNVEKKSNLPTVEDYRKWIQNALIKKGIIKSYSHKPHLASLPHDLSTTNPDELQERYDELANRIKEIKDEWGWTSKAYGDHVEDNNARDNRMEFYGKKFKTIDKRIYKECKDLINELKPLAEEGDKLHKKYITEDNDDGYPGLTNYGKLGELNPYEEFLLFCDQFKSKNAGKGNQILES